MIKKYCQIAKELFHVLTINPGFFFKRVFLQLRSYVVPVPKTAVSKKINGILLKFDFDYSPIYKSMYLDTYQPSITDLIKKNLKNGDTFIDVGANMGYFSAVAAGIVGKEGQVHSFEPVPEYFQRLKNIADTNSQYKIAVNQFALGDEEKTEKIYIGGHSRIGNNTFFPDLFDDQKGISSTEVSVRRLDKYIKEKNINNIKLIKIDVEGFEFPVLRGLKDYFSECSRTGSCPSIICEIVPGVYPDLGCKLEDLFDYMEEFSYYPFEIFNTEKRINIDRIRNKHVTDVFFKFCK